MSNLNPRLLLFAVAVVLVALVVWVTRRVLTPFAVGLVLAYLLAPIVARLHRALPQRIRSRSYARQLAIVIVYVSAVLLFVLALALVLPPLAAQAAELIEQVPDQYSAAQERLLPQIEQLESQYQLWPPELRTMVEDTVTADNLQEVALTALDTARRGLLATVSAVGNTIGWLLAFFVVPFWLFFVLNDAGQFIRGTLRLFPRDIRPDAEAVRRIVDSVLSAYIRGQLLIALILWIMTSIALFVLDVPYALLLGFMAGLFGLIPFLGPFLGAVPAVTVAALQDIRLALWVVLAFVIIQQIDNVLVSPRIQGEAVALPAALIMVVLVMGQALIGPIGLIIAVPVTAILRDVGHYLYLRVGDEALGPVEALRTVGYEAAASPFLPSTKRTDAAEAAG